MENEIKTLISTFKEYRDLLSPIEENLRAFSVSLGGIKEDLKSLNVNFSSDVQGKLSGLAGDLNASLEKSKSLTSQVDKFLSSSNRYISAVDSLISLCGKIEGKLSTVENLQSKAEGQIERLDGIIEEKKKTYDLKQLEKNLEAYNVGVQKVSEYINKDIADSLKTQNEEIKKIQDSNSNIYTAIVEEKGSIEKLINSYTSSNEFLKKIVDGNDVNEEYIFEILDRWAEERRLKIKK